MIDGYVYSVAASADVVVVGTGSQEKAVLVFDMTNGRLLRSFGLRGSGEGRLSTCLGIRFTPDGGHILIAEENGRLSQFSLIGAFVRCIGSDTLADPGDVDFAANGDILVADRCHDSVFVFSREDGSFLRTCGWQGLQPGCFKYPTALAMHGGKLYVLDQGGERVQVFN